MKKILFMMFLCIYVLSISVYAKYSISYDLECFEIIYKKDNDPPQYEISYSENSWTNKNVIITIKFNEEVKGVEGFELKNGGYQKVISDNEQKQIEVEDLAGNKTLVEYNYKYIDKEIPQILGIQNNMKYNSKQIAQYKDDLSGISEIKKVYYGDLLIDSYSDFYNTSEKLGIDVSNNKINVRVLRAPKNIVEYKYYRIEGNKENCIKSDRTQITFNNNESKVYKFYVIAKDSSGKEYKSNIIERKCCYFEKINFIRNGDIGKIELINTSNNISKIEYVIKCEENDIKMNGKIENFNLEFDRKNFNYANRYIINLKFYTKNGLTDERTCYINYNENYSNEDNQTFSKNGNYEIILKDNAGNQNIYNITIEK